MAEKTIEALIALEVWYSNGPLCIIGLNLTEGIINEDIRKAHKESIITIKGVILLNANYYHLVIKVFP